MTFARLSEVINRSINNANKIKTVRFRAKHLTRNQEKAIESHLNSIISTDKFQAYQEILYKDLLLYGTSIIKDISMRDIGALNDTSRV